MSLLDQLLTFSRVLRQAALGTHAGRTTELVQALAHVNLGSRDEVYHTCRALLVHRQDQMAIFDVAFDAFWRSHRTETIRNRRQDANAADARISVVDLRDVLESQETSGDVPDEDSTTADRVARE